MPPPTPLQPNRQLEDRITGILTRVYETDENAISEHAVILTTEVIKAAALYWVGFDADDFCVQHVTPEGIVFGSVNRLIWFPARGFYPDPLDCTPKFLDNARAIGPVPNPRITS